MGKSNEQAVRWLEEIEASLLGWESRRSQVAPEGLPFDYNDFCIQNPQSGARFSLEMAAQHMFRRSYTAVTGSLNAEQRVKLDAGVLDWVCDMNSRLNAWDRFREAASTELHQIWSRCPPRVPAGRKRALRKRISSMFAVWDGPTEEDWVVWGRKKQKDLAAR